MIVTWTNRALDRLADIYVRLPVADQRRLVAHVEELNERLRTDPWFLGESRDPPNRRMWYTDSLVVTYELRLGGRVVVMHVSAQHGRSQED